MVHVAISLCKRYNIFELVFLFPIMFVRFYKGLSYFYIDVFHFYIEA